MRRAPATLLLIGLCLIAFWSTALQELLVYDRHAIQQGEYWRLLSGHSVHFSPVHLASDLLAFAALGVWLETRHRVNCALLYLLMGLAIGGSLYLLEPELQEFGGLSGIAYGQLTCLALLELRGQYRNIAGLALAGLALKIGLEFNAPLSHEPLQDFIPVPLSHAAGSAAALMLFGAAQLLGSRKEKGPTLAGEPLSFRTPGRAGSALEKVPT